MPENMPLAAPVQAEALFDVPDDAYTIPPAPEEMNASQRRKRLIARRIGVGMHPLGYVPLHPAASKDRDGGGPRCGGCRFRMMDRRRGHYPKCHFPVRMGDHTTYPRVTGSETSDIRAWWPACRDFEEAPK